MLLANLVANAFAFSTPQGEVRVSVSGDGSGLFLVLENTASLADAEFLSWFFDPTDTSPRGGSGRGVRLYLVREVVEENGGEVRLRMQGNRVVFKVFLPWEENQWDRE
ncbi:MAG: ATP-binding protein [Candidatus Caldatribacterium sp.]|nr:ATP-binding protein [Candidatus Caldatribacterium sp.]